MNGSGGAGWIKNYLRGSVLNRSSHQRKHSQTIGEAIEAEEEREIGLIQNDIAELKLVVATMMKLLVHNDVLKIEDMIRVADAIDELDGELDGKLNARLTPKGTLKPEKKPKSTNLDQLSDTVIGE